MNRMGQGHVAYQTNEVMRRNLLGLVFFKGDFKQTSVCGFIIPGYVFRDQESFLDTLDKFSDRFLFRLWDH